MHGYFLQLKQTKMAKSRGDFLRIQSLIDRGFDDWLKIYDKSHPPASDLDLLAKQIGQAWLDYRQTREATDRARKLKLLLDLESCFTG